MKHLIFYFFMMAYSIACAAQIPKPTLHSLTGIGSVGTDGVSPDVVATPDGGFILQYNIYTPVAGNSPLDSLCSTTTGNRTLFAKYNADASSLQWIQCFPVGNVDSFPFQIRILPNGDSMVFGYYPNIGMYISKYDATGNFLWTKKHGSVGGKPLPTLDGGFIFLGHALQPDTNFTIHYGGWMSRDLTVYKVDSMGNKQWSKVYGGTDEDVPVSILNTSDGGWYIVANSMSNDHDVIGNKGGYDVYIAKIDDTGKLLWHKNIGGSETDRMSKAISNGKNGFYIAGSTFSNDGDVQHHQSVGHKPNMWLMEVDSTGQLLWENCYGGGGGEAANAICQSIDGSLWIGGISQESGGQVDTNYESLDAYIVHADNNGNLLSALVLGSSGFGSQDYVQVLHTLANSKILVGGRYTSNNGSFSSLTDYGYINIFHAQLSPTPTSIFEIQTRSKKLFKAYPNPAKDILQIEVFSTKEYTLTIHDNTGKKVVEQKTKGNKSINISDWAAGIYYIQYSNSIKEMYQQKIIIQ